MQFLIQRFNVGEIGQERMGMAGIERGHARPLNNFHADTN